jgi:hypothetical protein
MKRVVLSISIALLVIVLCFIFISIIYCLSVKENIGFPAHNPNHYTLLKFRGLGMVDEIGILGYKPEEFIVSLVQVYPCSFSNNEIRKIKINSLITNQTANCYFEDYFSDGSVRAKGEAKVHFTLGLLSCCITEYENVTYFDRKGREISNIKNGTGIEILLDDAGNVIIKAEYTDYICNKIVFRTSIGTLLYEGKPPIPPDILYTTATE